VLKQYNGVYYSDWLVSDAKAAIIMVHGMGAQSRRYTWLSERLNAEKISGYAIELQGFGELAGDKKGHIDSMTKYHKALAVLKEHVKAENPGRPVFILGESMGGLIATNQVLSYDSDYKGLISIVPAYKDVLKINGLDRVKIFLLSVFKSSAEIKMPFVNTELTSDPVMLEKLNRDPGEHKIASAALLKDNLLEQLNVMMKIKGLKTPFLLLVAGKDYLIDTNFAVELFKKVETEKKYIVYPGSLHALTIEKNREEVFGDIIKWINQILIK
jgi:alpha-beta hydrolase superfamily lysophospholipase